MIHGPKAELGGFLKPPLQILTKSLVAVGFFNHVHDDDFRFLRERGPFLGRKIPVLDNRDFGSEDSVFFLNSDDFSEIVRRWPFGVEVLDFLSFCGSQFVGVHANTKHSPIMG